MKNSTALVKKAEKETREKVQGMQSSHEDPDFLRKIKEMDTFYKFTKKIQLHVRRILSHQQTLSKFNRELYGPLTKISSGTEFRKTLKSIGETHAASFKEEETFLTAQIRYEHLLTRILSVNLNTFHEAKQDYEVSKINFDIATHHHTSLNSVPGQKLTAAQLKLDQETDNYQNSKKAISDLHIEYLEVEANLSTKTLEMERARKNFLAAQVTKLEDLLDENGGVN